MPKASTPRVRRFAALLLDLGFKDRRSFGAAIGVGPSTISRLMLHDFAAESVRNRVAKALGLSLADLAAIVANERRIAQEARKPRGRR